VQGLRDLSALAAETFCRLFHPLASGFLYTAIQIGAKQWLRLREVFLQARQLLSKVLELPQMLRSYLHWTSPAVASQSVLSAQKTQCC
jgi:hypothetical protein